MEALANQSHIRRLWLKDPWPIGYTFCSARAAHGAPLKQLPRGCKTQRTFAEGAFTVAAEPLEDPGLWIAAGRRAGY